MPMTHAGNSRWNSAPESGAEFQREFPARVATKFALVFSASFQRENMAKLNKYNLLLIDRAIRRNWVMLYWLVDKYRMTQ